MKKSTMTVEAEIVTPPQEQPPTVSSVPPLLTEYHEVALGKPAPPTHREIQQAIEILGALKAGSPDPVCEGSVGDVFLVYDLSLRSPGRPPYRITAQIPMHGILTLSGLPDAETSIESSIQNMMRPLRAQANSLIYSARKVLDPAYSIPDIRSGQKRIG